MALFNNLFNRTTNKILESKETILGPCEFISEGTVDEYETSMSEGSKWNKIYKDWRLK